MMRHGRFLLLLGALAAFVVVSCVQSELSWAARDASPSLERQMTRLPCIAVGNLSTYVRSGGLEFMCTSLYDVPGGYCYYFTTGVSFWGGIE